MSLSKQAIIIASILSIVLFIAGFYTWSSFFLLMLPIVNDVKYLDTDLSMPLWDSLVFGLTLALIPAATVLVWKLAPIFNNQRKVLTACIIVLTMMVFVIIRREVVKSQLRNLKPSTTIDYSNPASPVQKSIELLFPIVDLNFEYFVLIGLISGSTISLFALKEKKK